MTPQGLLDSNARAASGPPLPRYRPLPLTELILGFTVFLGISVYFHFSDLDLSIASSLFRTSSPHWGGQDFPWSLLYHFGQQPALLVGIAGLVLAIASYRNPAFRAYRGPGLYLFLLLLLGPGLLVNVIAKGLTGRPRPEDLIQFHGAWEFLHAYDFSQAGRGQSFISGHCASAFYFFGFYFILERPKRFLAFALTLLFGLLMGWTRMLQGAHFLSDVLLAGALMFCLAALLSPLLDWQPSGEFLGRSDFRLICGAGILGYLLISNPIFEQRRLRWALPHAAPLPEAYSYDRLYYWASPLSPPQALAPAVSLELKALAGTIHVAFDAETVCAGFEPLLIEEQFEAGALPGAIEHFEPMMMSSVPSWPLKADELAVSLEQRLRWPYWDASGDIYVDLPSQIASEARLQCEHGGITIGTLGKDAQVLVYGNFDPQSLPPGFEAYGSKAYRKAGSGPLIVLKLDAPDVRFEP